MSKLSRQSSLIELVRKAEKMSVEALASTLGASRETIRRDLTELSESGQLQKIHGGATMPRPLGEGPFQQRLSQNTAAKMAIAKAAAKRFQPGETLFIDTGSTTLYFAEEAAKISGLTIISNSTEIARIFERAQNGHQVFLLGGAFSADNSQTLGAMVTAQICAFRADHAVLTIGALHPQFGAIDYNIEEAQVARAMVERSARVTVLADHTKLGATASFTACPMDKISTLVTNAAPPAGIQSALKAQGGQIITA